MLLRLSNNSTAYYVHAVIMALIVICFPYAMPAVSPLTPLGVTVLGIFVALLYGWLFCDVVWPSLVGLILLGLSGYDNVGNVMKAAMGNPTVIMLILFCAVTAILSSAGIAEYISIKMVGLKVVQKRPYMLTLMLMLVMVILNLLVSATAAVMMFFPLVKEVSRHYGFKAGDKWPVFMILAGTYIGCVAYQLLPFKSGPAIVYGSYTQLTGVTDINYAAYMFCVFIILLVSIAASLAICKFIIKPNVELIKNTEIKLKEKEIQLSTYQKYVLISFLVLLCLLLWPNVAPKQWYVTKLLNSLTTNGILMVYIAIYLFLNFKEGIGFKTILSKEMSWPAIYLVAAALTIAAAFQAESTGIMLWIGKMVEPVVAGQSVVVFMLLIMLLTTLVTNVSNNLATLAIFTPLACTVGASFGEEIQMVGLLLCVLMTGSLGLITPPASSCTAYLYGEKEWLPGNSVMKYGILFCSLNFIIVFIFGYYLGSFLF